MEIAIAENYGRPAGITAPPDPKDYLSVALDFPSAATALSFVDSLEGSCRWFKVGMELFYASGSGLIHTLRDRGFEIFLDLKLHDIPNTAAGAVRSVAGTGASLLTVHASGGERMMEAAVEAAHAPGAPRIVAVTVLTSMDDADLRGIGIECGPREQALRLAVLSQQAGVAGMVCSPEEVSLLRAELNNSPLLVVPGIRPEGAPVGDQRRISTPGSAIQDGASMLVVGRPITQAANPAEAASGILTQIETALHLHDKRNRERANGLSIQAQPIL